MRDRNYIEAAHAMQSGVASEIELKGEKGAAADPKNLRVGVNMAMADQAGLASLLIAKGVFTKEEYIEAITKSANDEADRYQKLLSEAFGRPVTLA